MARSEFRRGMQALGYNLASSSMHGVNSQLRNRHPYAPELQDLLDPAGEIRAEAVFDVEGVPTVCFFSDDGSLANDEKRLAEIRQRIWNQNLISLILILTPTHLVPVPVTRKAPPAEPILRSQVRPDGPLSCPDIQSGDVWARFRSWFQIDDRVDRKLLSNLRVTVRELCDSRRAGGRGQLSVEDAQYLVSQLLFVSYLEHRGIVGDRYRAERKVGKLIELIQLRDRQGVVRLLSRLKSDFNGDFLEPEAGSKDLWLQLHDKNFDVLLAFLSANDMETGQLSIWPYNFRFIPVELLSGIYEAFLGKESKREVAAFYTPRHLANLVVDQALHDSADLLGERIYDGACGSGILLTTAFRKILGEAEARRNGVQIPLAERIILLKSCIFGSDISDAACRVTAFSLYLSLLERLEPADIVALCDDDEVKLPTLRGVNLFGGPQAGEFFSSKNPLVKRGDFTLFLSNPPWVEPKQAETSAADTWAAEGKIPRALRQLAADFAWRAVKCLSPSGRLCMILPMSLLLKPTSQEFLSGWLQHVQWHRVINFGDLKELLFDEGRKSCVVVLATPRIEKEGAQWIIPPNEMFEYWVPKADVSLAFGRLTLHSGERHRVQTQSIALSNKQLTTRMWGDDFDLALWAELRLRGTFNDLVSGPHKRWVKRKGFHRTDNAVPSENWVSSRPLWEMTFIRPGDLYHVPVPDLEGQRAFPRNEIQSVPKLSDDVLAAFHGPRILFPDGPSPDLEIRAAFTDVSASFMSSVGVIAGPAQDADYLRFATVFLRSDLVRYFMVTQLYQVLSDRDRVSLSDVGNFPFYLPDRHPDPATARKIVKELAGFVREIEKTDILMREHRWLALRAVAEVKLLQYFDLNESAQALVRETVDVVLPAVRPYGMSDVFERAGKRASDETIKSYVGTLLSELDSWRDARKGKGKFSIEALLTGRERSGPFGVVRVNVGATKKTKIDITRNEVAVKAVLEELQRRRMLPMSLSDNLYFVADTIIVSGDAVFLIKPQNERFWLRRQALRDAERIVEATTRPSAEAKDVA